MAGCAKKKAGRKTSRRSMPPVRVVASLAAAAALILVVSASLHAGSAAEVVDYVRVDIDDISYLGGDRYKMELSVLNRSDIDIEITEIRSDFFLQTEVIGGWAPLENKMSEQFRGGTIPSGSSRNYSLVLAMPLEIPRLYVNAFGEVNLKFVYRAEVSMVERSKVHERRGERFYWVTPRTGKWVLREGM